jgi:hypothetical protein
MDQDGHAANTADEDRREFLKACGKFASITPPALALLMSTTLKAQASSHRGGDGGHDGGNGGHDGGNGGHDGGNGGHGDGGNGGHGNGGH